MIRNGVPAISERVIAKTEIMQVGWVESYCVCNSGGLRIKRGAKGTRSCEGVN